MNEEDKFQELKNGEYEQLFGVKKRKKYDLHKNAFKKAWETRNFEIDKFWQRSMFFWGFLVFIFGGYFKVVTEKNTSEVMYLDYYMILLGIIFSVAWLLVICGSKRWQENWEKHIDYLEDEITGPLYKTLYYKGNYYYSVSGINQILAVVIIVIWVFLLIQYFFCKWCIIKIIFKFSNDNIKEFVLLFLPFVCTVICIMVMLITGQSFRGELNDKIIKEGNDSFFIKKDKKNQHSSDTHNCPANEVPENVTQS